MSEPEDEKPDDGSDGWDENGAEEALGTVQPSPELEEALREAAASVGADGEARPADEAAPEDGTAAEGDGPAALQQAHDQLQERLLRLQADFDNHRKRSLKEKQDALNYGNENLVKDLLGTVDNLDRAIDHATQSESGDFQNMLQGVELVRRELLATLQKHGVSEVEASQVPFDPNVHEAMAQVEDGSVPNGTVMDVLQKGYVLKDRLLRPARVLLSKAPTTSGSEGSEPEAPPEEAAPQDDDEG